MKVFVTSATGYIGAEVAKLLLAEGHTVAALARSQESARKLKTLGVEPVIGDLQQLDLLSSTAASADAVIHTAFGHAGVYEDAVKMDMAAISAMTDALAGSQKAFIMSSGTGFLGNTGPIPVSEEYPLDPDAPSRSRCLNERATLDAAGKGVRSVVFRLPQYVWGHGGSFFIPHQLDTARKLRKAYYILPGDQMTSGAHVDDVARAYLLALKHAPAGSVYHISTSHHTTIRGIAEAVGANLGVPAEGISLEDALAQEVWPDWMAHMWSYNNRVKANKVERELHWTDFIDVDMLDDIRSGSYKTKDGVSLGV